MKQYDENQWYYANKTQMPIEKFDYNHYVCKYKVHGIFWKKIIVYACCVTEVFDMHKDKNIKSIKKIEK